ncbi:MAG: hypothetical protein AB8B55_08275 [Mariniblastus sp.]
MARLIIVCLVAFAVVAGNETASAQTTLSEQPRLFQPLLKNIRKRAANGVIADAQRSSLGERISPKGVEARQERAAGRDANQAIQKRFEEAELKKLESEAKKAELDAKLAAEQDAERNKPWEIEDPENLESPSDLLKLAAESKQDANLAGKKQQALEFLAKLGCNKDPRVEKAILAGLKDHDANVRLAAIQAVLVAARGPAPQLYNEFGQPIDQFGQPIPAPAAPTAGDGTSPVGMTSGQPTGETVAAAGAPAPAVGECTACRGKRERKKIFTGHCKRCRGGGCDSCNYCGQETQVYSEPCTVCQPTTGCVECQQHDRCKTCCPSKAIMAELKRIAFEPDPQRENCNYEPSLDVRNLALEALNVCPKLAEPTKKNKNGISETPGDEDESSGVSEDGGDVKLEGPKEDEQPGPDSDAVPMKKEGEGSIESLDDDTTVRSRNSAFQSVGYRSENRMLDAEIKRFYQDDAYLVKFDDSYIIPVGKSLYVENAGGDNQIVEVIQSETGLAKVKPLNGTLYYQEGTQLKVGIIE